MTKTLFGTIHGKTIELEQEAGLPDGKKVEITLRIPAPPGPSPKEPKTAAGMLAAGWTEEDDRILEEIHRERRKESRREISE